MTAQDEKQGRTVPTPIAPAALAEARSALPSEELLVLVVEAFKALGDPTRARILYGLIRQPLCVRDLSLLAGVSESAVSHQLRLLRDRRLVKSLRDGNTVYYSVSDRHVAALIREAEYHADHIFSSHPDHPYPLP